MASDAQDSIRSFAGRLIVDYIESQFSDEADMENFMNRNTFEITPQYNPDIPLGRLSDLVLQWIFKAVVGILILSIYVADANVSWQVDIPLRTRYSKE